MLKINRETALNWLRAVVEERGEDFIYRAKERQERALRLTCEYGEPNDKGEMVGSCGVGQAFYRFAPDVFAELVKYEKEEGDSFSVREFADIDIPVQMTPAAEEALAVFQEKQDSGVEYGRALDVAEEMSSAAFFADA